MENQELVNVLMNRIMELKQSKLSSLLPKDDLTHNERLVLFIIHGSSKDSRISLSMIREKIRLAPSTITPVITSLEEKGLIQRNIDKNDRRNIFLQISDKGNEYTSRAHENLTKLIYEYIKYIGEDEIKKLINILSKTTEFVNFKKKGEKINEKSF